ncbi:tetratricopeptide repeat protein [Streptomyces sp. NPDC093568]|uniref:tetratricopeptide repeat protein n=1 Tax=Streptomyces sp. NPDC093568 TaxID=3366041 RepID=UPI003817223B
MALWERAPWLVNIARSRDGLPYGAGVLVTDRHILTCAHVASKESAGPKPADPLFIRFQWVGDHDPLPAIVVDWHPQESEGPMKPKEPQLWRGDVAVLELQEGIPDFARPAPLVTALGGTSDHRFHVYGYPEGPHQLGGVPANGVIRGAAGLEWIALESESAIGHGIAQGFSGSPLWDRTLSGVIGIVATRDTPSRIHDPRTAYAIPVDALATYWPPLRDLIRDPVTEEQRARIDDLLALSLDDLGELPRVHDVRIYDIGVTPSKNLGQQPNPPYVRRLEDRELEEALAGEPFILLSGDAKAGKSRTLIELLRRRLPEGTRLIVPRPIPSAPGELASLPLPTGGNRAVLWLDDIDEYLRPGGVDTKVLKAFSKRKPPITVVGTITSEWFTRLSNPKSEVNRTASQVLADARRIVLARLLRDEERAEARRYYPDEDFSDRGIGEQMVAAPLVEERFNGGHDACPEGWAVVRAATDWHRMGCEVPLTRKALSELFARYLAAGPSHRAANDAALEKGITWATTSVVGTIALLSEYAAGTYGPGTFGRGAEQADGLSAEDTGERRYKAFAYLPGYLDSRQDPDTSSIPHFAWDWAVHGVPADNLLGVAFAAFTRDEGDVAVRALERAHRDAAEHDVTAWAALMLGELAMHRKDMAPARALLEEAAGSESADVVPLAQVELAAVLQLTGDGTRAREVLEAAIDSSDPQAAPLARASLGGLLLGLGETARARELLESALESGDAQVMPLVQSGFGGLIVQRGEMSGAGALAMRPASEPLPSGAPAHLGGTEPLSLPRAVRESAISSAVPLAQVNLSAALLDQGELGRADELLRKALDSENPLVVPLAQANLGALCIQRGDLQRARELLDAAASSDHLFAAEHAHVTLAWLLLLEEKPDQAKEILAQAFHFTNPQQVLRAHCLLSTVLASQGEFGAAAEQLQTVVDSEQSGWAALARADQGLYWAQAGDYDRAHLALTEIARSSHPDQAPRAADLLGDLEATLENWTAAEAAYRAAIESGHPVWSQLARMDLALLLSRLGDERGPQLLAEIADSDEPELGPRAADLLGDTLAAGGDWAGAEASYQRAMDSGHAYWSAVARVDLALMLADRNEVARAEDLFLREAESGSVLAGIAEAFLGILLVQQGRVEEGLPRLTRIAASDSVEAADLAGVQLAKLAAEEGRPEEAIERFQALLASGSEIAAAVAPLARAHLGAIMLQQGELDAALELLDEATASGQADAAAVAFAGRGEYLVEVGDTTAARLYLDAALELDEPDVTPRALTLLGVAMLAENDLQGAGATLAEALADATPMTEPMTRRYLGSALARLGRRSEAREVLLPLASSDDLDQRPPALVILGQLAMLDGRVEEARAWFGEAVASNAPEARAQALEDATEHPPTLPEVLPTRGPALTAAPQTREPAPPPLVPAPDRSACRAPLSVGLRPDLLLLLGRIAEGEGLPEEARYWHDKAVAAGLRPDEARSLLASLPRDDAED